LVGSNVSGYRSTDQQFVVGGYFGVGNTEPDNLDLVGVSDKTANGIADQFVVWNGSYSVVDNVFTYAYEQVVVSDYVLDFITGTDLAQSFSLTAGDLVSGWMVGEIQSVQYDKSADYYLHYDVVDYSLSSISVHPIPEPGTLSLLSAGLVLLGLMRRSVTT
jgi:hypothetical protein